MHPSTSLRLLRDLARELQFGVRMAARRPVLTAAIVSTLALAIGTPTAIFSVVHAVLLRPLPFSEPDRLVRFRMEGQGPRGHVAFDALPASMALGWSRESSTLAGLTLFNDRAMTLSSDAGPFRLNGAAVTPDFFDVLGVSPVMGRRFHRDLAGTRSVMLSDEAWGRFFGRDPAIVDSVIVLDGERHVVIGVMPRDFRFPDAETAFWTPMVIDEGGSRGMLLPAIARLRPGADVASALEEGSRVIAAGGGMAEALQLTARTLQDQMTGGVRRLLLVLMTAVTIVFLIGCTNIALLMLTGGAAREREFSTRLALGVSRPRLAMQVVAEVLVLAAAGGVAGVALAATAAAAFVRVAPRDIPRLDDSALDGAVVAFALALIAIVTLAFAVIAAGRALGADPTRSLGRLGGESSPVSRASRRRLQALAASQFALTTVLLVAAGLLLRSFVAQATETQGFETRQAIAMQVNLPSARYPAPSSRIAFHERLLDRMRQVPGVHSAGIITTMPNRQATGRFALSATPVPEPFDPLTVSVYEVRMASEGFLEALGVPLRSGRLFDGSERPGSEPTVVISERLAREQFGADDAVGRVLYSGDGVAYTVIGVVGDVRPAEEAADGTAAAYLPFRQHPGVFQWFATATVVARGEGAARAATTLRALVLSLDPEMPPFNVRTLDDEVARLLAGPRFSASLVGLFAIAALVLASVGVYGVMAYVASRRTREIGVRIALGATRGSVLRLMLRDAMGVVGAGLAAGSIGAVLFARALTGLLHDVRPTDPVSLAAVALILGTVGALAAYLPASRATSISAAEALRGE